MKQVDYILVFDVHLGLHSGHVHWCTDLNCFDLTALFFTAGQLGNATLFTAVAMSVVNETDVLEIRKDDEESVIVLINQQEVDLTSTQSELRGKCFPFSTLLSFLFRDESLPFNS